jgi:hypothetical protein
MKKIISNAINSKGDQDRGQFEFASLNYKNGHFYLRNTPSQSSVRSDTYSLKDGVYKIIEGVLYIQATRIFYETVDHFAEKLDKWNLESHIYLIDQEQLDALENPPVLKDIRIKRTFGKDKWIRGYEVPYVGMFEHNQTVENMKWFKCKMEISFEYASSQFVLIEKDQE